MRKQSSKSIQPIQLDIVKTRKLNQVPEYYQSMANNPTLDRLQRTTVRENLPTLIEVVEGTLQLNEHGESRQVFKFINQIFTKPPLVVGFGRHPNCKVIKFPSEDMLTDSISGETFPIYIGIGIVTTNSVQLSICFNMCSMMNRHFLDIIPIHRILYPF